MWVLLGSKVFLASEVNEIRAGRFTLKTLAFKPSDDAFFRSLQSSKFARTEAMPFAHQHTGGLAKVSHLKRCSEGTDVVWELTLRVQPVNTGSDLAHGPFSSDEIATLRARLILLNEKPKMKDLLLQPYVEGLNAPVKVTGSALPLLWKDAKGDSSLFLRGARLWCVFHLISTNTCEHILDLTLGPIRDEKMHVRFRGQRRRTHSNVDPYVIELEGDCNLAAV